MTKKIGVKGITCTLLATFLFLSVGPDLVMAQSLGEVCFYQSAWLCLGETSCCINMASDQCCNNADYNINFGFSASVNPPTGRGESIIYQDWACSTRQYGGYGYLCQNGMCFSKYHSGKWRRLTGLDGAEPGSEKPCNETVSPNTLQYKFITEDRRRASWVLPMASLTEADSNGPSRDLPAEERVIWFKSRGATLKVEDHQTTPVPDYNAYSPTSGLTLPHPLDPCS